MECIWNKDIFDYIMNCSDNINVYSVTDVRIYFTVLYPKIILKIIIL